MARVYQNRNGQLIPVTPDTSIEKTVDDLSSRVDQLHISGSYTLPPATTSTLGGAMPDGQTITVDADGTIHVGAGDPLVPSDAAPEPLGDVAAVGTSTEYARADHVHQKEEVPMFSGDAATMTISADTRLTADGPRRLAVTATTVDCKLILPSGDAMSDEGIAFIITNAGQYDITVTTVSGQPIGTDTDGGKLAPGKMRFYLMVDPDNGMWACDEWAGNAVVNKETKKYEGMTAGTPITFNDSTFTCTKYWAKLDEERVVIVYRGAASPNPLYACVLSITDSGVTVGMSVTIETAIGGSDSGLYLQELSAGRVLVVYAFPGTGTFAIKARVLSVDRSTINMGDTVTLVPSAGAYFSVQDLFSDRVVVVWHNSLQPTALVACVLSFSDLAVIVSTAVNITETGSYDGMHFITKIAASTILLIFRGASANTHKVLATTFSVSPSNTILKRSSSVVVDSCSDYAIQESDDKRYIAIVWRSLSAAYYAFNCTALYISGETYNTLAPISLYTNQRYPLSDGYRLVFFSDNFFIAFCLQSGSPMYFLLKVTSTAVVNATQAFFGPVCSSYYVLKYPTFCVIILFGISTPASITGGVLTVDTSASVLSFSSDKLYSDLSAVQGLKSCPLIEKTRLILVPHMVLPGTNSAIIGYKGGLINQYQGSVTLVAVDETGNIDPDKCQTLGVTELTGTNPGEVGSTNLIQMGDTVLFMTEAKYRGNKLEIIPISFSS